MPDAIAADNKIKSEKVVKAEAKKKAANVQAKETQLLMLHCMSPGCEKKRNKLGGGFS